MNRFKAGMFTAAALLVVTSGCGVSEAPAPRTEEVSPVAAESIETTSQSLNVSPCVGNCEALGDSEHCEIRCITRGLPYSHYTTGGNYPRCGGGYINCTGGTNDTSCWCCPRGSCPGVGNTCVACPSGEICNSSGVGCYDPTPTPTPPPPPPPPCTHGRVKCERRTQYVCLNGQWISLGRCNPGGSPP